MIPQILRPNSSSALVRREGRRDTYESYDFLSQSVRKGFGERTPVLFTSVETVENHEGSTARRGFGSVAVGCESDGLPGGVGG